MSVLPIRLRKAIRALGYERDRKALLAGVAGSLEHAAVLRTLPAARTILDIGANRGQFILEAIKWHPNATFYAFEPLPMERTRMERVLAGLPRVSIFPFALGEADGSVEFQVSSAADSSSVLKQTKLQSEFFPGTQNIGQHDVQIRRLDNVIDRSALIGPVVCKIDVQGYELNVLKGFGDLIDAVDYLIIEVSNVPFYQGAPNSAEVISFLAERGFRIDGMYNMYGPRSVCLQLDILFSRGSASGDAAL